MPIPIAIVRNRYESSSGSLIAVRNLMIESAPIKPSDNASDDFTIVMINIVVIVIGKKLRANCFRLESADPYLV